MKRSSSQLTPYAEEILAWRDQGISLRKIAQRIQDEYGIKFSYNAVYSFLKTLDRRAARKSLFFESFSDDLRESLIKQFTALWTHESTAIEGNTLTLGETMKVLELGLTIGGKPLREHEEIYGHAKAVELVFELLKASEITMENLFDLHRCVMQKVAIDALRPVGKWKREFNGTTGILNGKPCYMEYASPSDTAVLMHRWLKALNRKLDTATSPTKAINSYAWIHLSFVRIHPFFDGNGRLARLIANVPLLRGGFPPLLISPEQHAAYIDLLWEYQTSVGVIQRDDRLLPPNPSLTAFKTLLRQEWKQSLILIQEAERQEAERKSW